MVRALLSIWPLIVAVAMGSPSCHGQEQTPSSAPAKEVTFDLGGVKMELLLIPAGSFAMGDQRRGDTRRPAPKVAIAKPFYLGKHEVTQRQWQAVMGGNLSHLHGPENPVEGVSWDDCRAFLRKLNENFPNAAGEFSLPTEAQWEYACRAGSTTSFCYGDDEAELGEYGWFIGNAGRGTHPVGGKRPNAWGLYDMHGNVYEWCSDSYKPARGKTTLPANAKGPLSGPNHVLRGGSWVSSASYCRAVSRSGIPFGPLRLPGADGCAMAREPLTALANSVTGN